MDREELAGALIGLWRWAEENAQPPEPEIRRRLREHLGADPAGLEVLTEDLRAAEEACEAVSAVAA